MSISDLPTVNALLNTLATVLLVTGYVFIRKKRVEAHKKTMIAAFVVSVAFLISYLTYHFTSELMTEFTGPRSLRIAYYVMLVSHIILAAAVPPLCLITLYRAAKRQFDRHRRIARITYPIWLYVSVTGVLIYLLLYVIYPPGAAD